VAKILVIEDEQNLRFSVRRTLARARHDVHEAGNLGEARSLISKHDFDLVITDVMLGSENGMEIVRELRAEAFDGVIVVMTAFGTVEAAVAAMKDGADDYLQKPLSLEELSLQAEKWLEQRRLARRVKLYERLEQARAAGDGEAMGRSPAWLSTLNLAGRLASIPLEAPTGEAGGGLPCILLQGETGVGKGVLARFIHTRACEIAGSAGSKSAPPFVHVNCSALPATLVEAELFGHEKGAFTDAREARPGLFEMADGGTIFLDEISETPLELQAKLLLVVEQGIYRRVGGSRERTVRVRVIAASNQDLEERVSAGTFRRDLLYRLNAFTIKIPALRQRDGDVLLIAEALLEKFARRYGRPGMTLGEEGRRAMLAHAWPGNVRELVNAVQRAAMLSEGTVVGPADLGLEEWEGREEPPDEARAAAVAAAPERGAPPAGMAVGAPEPAPTGSVPAPAPPAPGGGDGLVFDFDKGVHTADEVERQLIIQALRRTGGNVSRAAKLIGMQRSSLRYRIERYGLETFVHEVAKS